MFDPTAAKGKKAAEAQKKKVLNELKDWATNIIPVALREGTFPWIKFRDEVIFEVLYGHSAAYILGLLIDINEVICGDPSCAPVDTIITLVWANGGRGVFGIPLAPAEVKQDDLIEFFPVCLGIITLQKDS
jgi:hypothetical protein